MPKILMREWVWGERISFNGSVFVANTEQFVVFLNQRIILKYYENLTALNKKFNEKTNL